PPQEGGAHAHQLVAPVQEPRGEAQVRRHLPGGRGRAEPLAARSREGPVGRREADAGPSPPDPRVRADVRPEGRRGRSRAPAGRAARLIGELQRMATWCIVVAAGSGSRFGGDVPKQYERLGERRVLDWSLATAGATCDGVVLVVPPDRVDAPEP